LEINKLILNWKRISSRESEKAEEGAGGQQASVIFSDFLNIDLLGILVGPLSYEDVGE
jgi:hypothetical protein